MQAIDGMASGIQAGPDSIPIDIWKKKKMQKVLITNAKSRHV